MAIDVKNKFFRIKSNACENCGKIFRDSCRDGEFYSHNIIFYQCLTSKNPHAIRRPYNHPVLPSATPHGDAGEAEPVPSLEKRRKSPFRASARKGLPRVPPAKVSTRGVRCTAHKPVPPEISGPGSGWVQTTEFADENTPNGARQRVIPAAKAATKPRHGDVPRPILSDQRRDRGRAWSYHGAEPLA